MLSTLAPLILALLFITGCTFTHDPKAITLKPILNPISTTILYPTHHKHIALLLPLSGTLANAGNAIKEGFMAAYQQAKLPYSIDISIYDTTNTNLLNLYQQALRRKADFVIGPITKEDIIKLAGLSTQIPSIALNYIPNQQIPNGYYAFDLSPQSEAQQVALKARHANLRAALLITPASPWGQGIAQAFKTTWLNHGGEIVGTLNYTTTNRLAEQIKELLRFTDTYGYRKDADVILLAATPEAARQIRPLLKFYYAGNLPIYATSSIYTGQPSTIADRDLDGIIFGDMPWIISQVENQNPINFQQFTRLYAVGIDSFYLANHLEDLKSNSYAGATGQLDRDAQGRISRQLAWAQFRNGKAASL